MLKPKIFISYAHDDEPEHPGRDDVRWLSYVRSHLGPLESAAAVEAWADTNLRGSQDWEQRIFAAIEVCDIFILLVSRHSLKSKFILEKEIPRILARRKRNNSTEVPALYPIVLTPVGGLKQFRWLKTPNRMPKNGKALSEFELTKGVNQRDGVIAEIVNDILRVAKSLTTPPAQVVAPTPTQAPAKPATPVTSVSSEIPPVSGSYGLSPAQQSQGASGLDPVLREVLLCLTFTGLSRITTKHGTVVFSIREALLHTTITGGRIATARRAFPQGWKSPRAQVTRIGDWPDREVLRLRAEAGLEGEVLASRGEAGHVRLFDAEPEGAEMTIMGEVQVEYDVVHVDLARSETRRSRTVEELAKLVIAECGLTRLPLSGCKG